MKWRNVLVAMFVAPLLLGCPGDGAGITCPSAKTYSKQFLANAEKELDIIAPQAPHIVKMLADYDVTLRAIRKCLASKKKTD